MTAPSSGRYLCCASARVAVGHDGYALLLMNPQASISILLRNRSDNRSPFLFQMTSPTFHDSNRIISDSQMEAIAGREHYYRRAVG